MAAPAFVRKIIGDLGEEVKRLLCFGAAATEHMRQSDEGGFKNIGKLLGLHRLDSSGGKWLVHRQHCSERFCQGDDPSRCSRVHSRSEQLFGDGFYVYRYAHWNLIAASRARRR